MTSAVNSDMASVSTHEQCCERYCTSQVNVCCFILNFIVYIVLNVFALETASVLRVNICKEIIHLVYMMTFIKKTITFD